MAELQAAFPDIETKLVQSSGGRFEVTADGTTVFSKHALRRHAEPGEIVEAIRKGR